MEEEEKQKAHRHFAASCFNGVWELLEKESRSEGENQLLREMAHASLYHWLERDDNEPKNVSIGLWLIARVYSVLGEGITSAFYAGECIKFSEHLPAFYFGYAYEAAARAAVVQGNWDERNELIRIAESQLFRIRDGEERGMLQGDLEELKNAGVQICGDEPEKF